MNPKSLPFVFVATGAIACSSASAQNCGELVVWGHNTYGSLNNIPSVPMRAVSSNYHLSVGLDPAGQIHCWGAPDIRAFIPSRKGVVAIAAGNNWALARDLGGSIVAWGDNSKGQCNVPPGEYTDMACGDWHSVAVTASGAIRCWGDNTMGACNAPSGVFESVGAGSWHSLAITSSGEVVGWGYDFGQLHAPFETEFIQVVGGWKHSLGIDSAGSIRGWGTDIGGVLTEIPVDGKYLEIDCSASRGIALRDDGRVIVWGSPTSTDIPVPEGRFCAITAGSTVECGIRVVCQGDLVEDGIVNSADIAVVLNFWGTNGTQYAGVDLNSDGIVNGADLAAVLGAWGACPE